MEEKGSALIVCYTFPPMPGVGGRRWSKYSKYLVQNGWDVTVLAGTAKPGAYSPWDSDVEGIKQIRLPNRYPEVLNQPPRSIFEKIKYRLALIWVKAFSKVNYYDRGIFWKKQLDGIVEKLLQDQKLPNLIVSGAPFSLLYYGALWKQKYPEIRYIADIRDPWTNPHYYGFENLTEPRKQQEWKRLETVLNTADYIIVPNAEMKAMYESRMGHTLPQLLVIPHAVDEADLYVSTPVEKDRTPTELVNFGTIYNGQEARMRTMAKVLKGMGGQVKLTFFTGEKKYHNLFEEADLDEKTIEYKGIVPVKQVFEILSRSHAALFFLPNAIKDTLATKYIEVIASRTPIVAIGESGTVSEFLITNRLGVFIQYDEIPEKLPQVADLLRNLQYNKDYDFSGNTFEVQTRLLESLLIHHKPTND